VTHHYLQYDGLSPLSLRLRRKAWAHHREARRSHGRRRNNLSSAGRRGSPSLEEWAGKRRSRDDQSRRKNMHPDELRVEFS
jgi:hypothetical protein